MFLHHHRYEYSIYLLLIASEIRFWIVVTGRVLLFQQTTGTPGVALFFLQTTDVSSIKENTSGTFPTIRLGYRLIFYCSSCYVIIKRYLGFYLLTDITLMCLGRALNQG